MSEHRPGPRDIEALVRRLDRDVAPATDLWPDIAHAIAPGSGRLEARLGGLEREIAPRRDLWPGIRAQIASGARAGVAPGGFMGRFAMAASLAATALIAALFVLVAGHEIGTQTQQPIADRGSDDAWWIELIDRAPRAASAHADELTNVLELVRTQYVAVRGERLEIEAALDRAPTSPMLAALWRHTYEQELALTARAQEIADSYSRG